MGFSLSCYQEVLRLPVSDQRGGVQLVLQTSSHQQVETPGVYTWQTAFAAWSPDGRYLVGPFLWTSACSRRAARTQALRRSPTSGLAQWPLLPVRDAALDQISAELAHGNSQQHTATRVAT